MDVVRHNKYKTKHCQKYWIAGYCAYGPRCNFIHQEQENQKFQGGSVTGSSMDTVAKNRAINPSPIPMTMKTAAQVTNLANLRKMGLSDSNPSGESSGSEDGKLPFSRGLDYDLQHYSVWSRGKSWSRWKWKAKSCLARSLGFNENG